MPSCCNMSICTSLLNFTKKHFVALVKKGTWMNCTRLYYVILYQCNVDNDNGKIIHVLTYIFNKVMPVFEFAEVVGHK